MAFTSLQVTLQRARILCQKWRAFTFLQRVSPWLANPNRCDIQTCTWMRSLATISTSACVMQISMHTRASFSPNIQSFTPTKQCRTTVLSLLLSLLSHHHLLIVLSSIISLYTRVGCKAWCYRTGAKSSLALPTLKRLADEEKLAKPGQWAEPEK